jgi:hypothetical protein
MLKGALGKLISGGGAAASEPVFNLATPYGRLQAFFREIENTTAQRRLSLTIGEAEMVFDLANKKVLRFISVKPDTEGRGAMAATIERNYDQLDGQLKLLAELLTAFVARAGAFDMVSRNSPVTYPAKADGFPAAEWRFACDLYGVVPAAVVPELARAPLPPEEPEEEMTMPEEVEKEVEVEAEVMPVVAAPRAPAAPVMAPVGRSYAPVAREPELVMAAAPAPVMAELAPAPAPKPAPVPVPEPVAQVEPEPTAAPGPSEADTISSIMTALGSAPDLTPEKVEPAAASPNNDPAQVERFYEMAAKYCDLAMLMTEDGDVLKFTDDAAGWFDLGPDIARDMKSWVTDTARIMPGCQMVMMRSPILQNQSVVFMTNGSMTAYGAFSSHVTGRIFSLANDFVGRKRA